jgi:hypothetical protein
MNDAADDPFRRHRAREVTAGIERFEPLAAVTECQAVKKPPRDAIHGGDDGRVAAQQRRNGLRDVCKAWGLHAD